MIRYSLNPGDLVGVIAPSSSVRRINSDIQAGINYLKKAGFRVKTGRHWQEKFYYSAGLSGRRLEDLEAMFADPAIKAIFCATGGSSANQLLSRINYRLIKNNPKIFLGFSDITNLLLSFWARAGLRTFHGPSLYELAKLTPPARRQLFDLLSGRIKDCPYPKKMAIWRSGRARGKLLGGNLTVVNGLLGTGYLPPLVGKILFWEDVGLSPADIDFKLNELKLSGAFSRITGMVIGHLSHCVDKKYPEDNRPIRDIVLEVTAGLKFPIIQVEYFGHDLNDFYTFPEGGMATLDTAQKLFSVSV